MQVRLLGPVDVLLDGVPRLILGRRRKALLAILALHDGGTVATDWLVHAIYGESASPGSVSTLQSHVSVLRGALGRRSAILARPPGYVLELDGGDTDVKQAERLLRLGVDCGDPVRAVRELDAALALWRGRPLADMAGVSWLEEQAERLDLLGGQVKRALMRARLETGEHVQLIPDLEQTAAEFPLDEQVCGQLMLALYRSGRQADALAAFHRLKAALDEQLAIYPGPELRELEMSILRQDPALDLAARPVLTAVTIASSTPVRPVPAQLPPSVPGFAGRAAELASLDSMALEAVPDDRDQTGATPISVVSGTAGVGKTALAVHWAHRISELFPDGQLYVNLRGFDPGGASVEPAEAMRGFLDALGVRMRRGSRTSLAAQAALYRSLLAGKRMLVVLDNARERRAGAPAAARLARLPGRGDQPPPPGRPGRDRGRATRSPWTCWSATRPATCWPAGSARDRVAREPEAVAEIIARCAGLPLALAIVAARAAVRPGFPLAAVAADLAGRPRPWTHSTTTMRHRRARRALLVLSRAERRRGAAVPAARPASRAGHHAWPPPPAWPVPRWARPRPLLAELVRAHLITEHAPGRYAYHDLLRAYAAELARACDTDGDRDVALRNDARPLSAHQPAGGRADRAVPAADRPGPAGPEVIVSTPVTAKAARAWFSSEQATLIGAVRCAVEAGLTRTPGSWPGAWAASCCGEACGARTSRCRRSPWPPPGAAALPPARLTRWSAGGLLREIRSLPRGPAGLLQRAAGLSGDR